MANDTFSAIAARPDATDAALTDIFALVEGALVGFVRTAAQSLAQIDDGLEPLVRVASDAVLAGGKRLRPTFAYWAWRGIAGSSQPVDEVVPALAALELLHAFALVHDDVMDEAAIRRGRPTAHRALAATHRRQRLRGDAERFGRSSAILVGDLCLIWADELMAMASVPGRRRQSARSEYDRMRVEAISGQFLDVLGEASRTWTVERALLTARLKTASYTVARPMLFGAALAGAEEGNPVREVYRRYGIAVGEAFQLRDDYLDLFADATAVGKTTGEDVANGTPTVLIQLARRLASPRQGRTLDRMLSRRRRANVHRISEIVRETGAATQLERMITERVAGAMAAIEGSAIEPSARAALAGLATAAAWRTT